MHLPRLVFVTGKGGAGKTTVCAALAAHLAAQRYRVLIVETDGSGRLGALFGAVALAVQPVRLQRRLYAVRLETQALLEEYFHSVLPAGFLARRLLSSHTFQALAAAAPGVSEFLFLQKLVQWAQPSGWVKRERFDLVLVDGPATGHALKVLGSARSIASLVPGGPIGSTARRALALLCDRQATRVVVVTLPEELAVAEAMEAYDALANDLALAVARPVLNRVYPRRFTRRELLALETDSAAGDPLVAAARFEYLRRRDNERYLARLRRRLGVSPVLLPMIFAERVTLGDVISWGPSLQGLLQ